MEFIVCVYMGSLLEAIEERRDFMGLKTLVGAFVASMSVSSCTLHFDSRDYLPRCSDIEDPVLLERLKEADECQKSPEIRKYPLNPASP